MVQTLIKSSLHNFFASLPLQGLNSIKKKTFTPKSCKIYMDYIPFRLLIFVVVFDGVLRHYILVY